MSTDPARPAPVPPHNETAERSVLGALLADPSGIALIDGWLEPEHFYLERHRWIYHAVRGLYRAGRAADLTTVCDTLGGRDQLAPLGGADYLTGLLYGVPQAGAVEEYARLVEGYAGRRDLIRAGQEIARLGAVGGAEIAELRGQAETALRTVTDRPTATGFVAVRDSLPGYFNALDATAQATAPPGWTTGLTRLDALIRWRKGQLIVPAARPGEGKSALVLGFALAAARVGAKVGIVSIEMDSEDVQDRLISMDSGLNLHALRMRRKLEADDWTLITNSSGELSTLDVYLLDAGRVSVPQIRGAAKQLKARHGLDLLIIDYLQLIKPATPTRGGNRTQEVDEISRDLKGLARDQDLRVPVIVPSQLSREIEYRAGRVPQLSDLRESGSIEADADVVIFIHRPDLTHPEATELHVAKHRNGPRGKVPVYWHAESVRFFDQEDRYAR